MRKHLYFICPTDHLEAVIDNRFQQENYYCTSLGNSVIFDADIMGHLNELIATKNIEEITFVLSDDNCIVKKAFEGLDFSDIRGLSSFYNQVTGQKRRTELLWRKCDFRGIVLSNYLHERIKELRNLLKACFCEKVDVNGKIYFRRDNVFNTIHSELFYMDNCALN